MIIIAQDLHGNNSSSMEEFQNIIIQYLSIIDVSLENVPQLPPNQQVLPTILSSCTLKYCIMFKLCVFLLCLSLYSMDKR